LFVVVSYDVVDDRRRNKIAKVLRAFGDRVQYSVFEMNVAQDELDRMRRKLERILKPKEDSVRIYLLCAGCKAKVAVMAQGQVTEDPDLVIV